MEETVEVSINNWEKFNPREDRKNTVWFRFQNSFFSDPKIFSLSADERLLFVFLCCECSKKNGCTTKIWLSHASALLRTSEDTVRAGLDKLLKLGLIVAGRKPASVRGRAAQSRPAPGIRTNERTKISDSQFGEVWEKYPRKIDPSKARARLQSVVNPKDLPEFRTAVTNYADHCLQNGTEEKFIKHMTTFIGTQKHPAWRDWLNVPEHQSRKVLPL